MGSIGVAGEYSTLPIGARVWGEHVTHVGMIFAAALNLHFALCFARVITDHRRAVWLYVLALVYLGVLAGGG